ncbi:MAG: hypothetical protein ACREET_16810 [Stellaceae bacterium]
MTWGNMLYDRDFMDASVQSGRGDVVRAETMPEHRSKSVIWLQRAGHWFSTTLIETRSWEVLIGLQWRNDDTLYLQLDFGCGAETSRPVTAVGPVRIVYRWGDPGGTPKVGYETFRRRDLAPEKCEPSGPPHHPLRRTRPGAQRRRSGRRQSRSRLLKRAAGDVTFIMKVTFRMAHAAQKLWQHALPDRSQP